MASVSASAISCALEDAALVRDGDADEAHLAAPAHRHAEQRRGREALDHVLAEVRIAGRVGDRDRRPRVDDARDQRRGAEPLAVAGRPGAADRSLADVAVLRDLGEVDLVDPQRGLQLLHQRRADRLGRARGQQRRGEAVGGAEQGVVGNGHDVDPGCIGRWPTRLDRVVLPGALTGAGVLLAELLELLGRRAGGGLLIGGRAVLRGGRGCRRGARVRTGAGTPVAPVLPLSAGVGVAVAVAPGVADADGVADSETSAAPFWCGTLRSGWAPGTSSTAAESPPQPERDERKAEKRQQEGGAEPAHGEEGQRGSAAMRRPQVGQSLRSFCASWSHQLQKRRFSVAHGSWDFDGGSGRTLPTTSSGSPVSRST